RKAVRVADYLHSTQRDQRAARNGPMQYLLNRRDWKTEEDWFAAQVFREAARWLDHNVDENQPFYLHIESFSPHEYWDPPDSYYRQYMKTAYRGPRLIAPPALTRDMSPIDVEHVRALYAGLVTFVDAQIGRFLKKVDALGLMKNTLIVLAADHGTMMGEQGQVHKGETRLRTQVTHVPMMIYYPRQSWAGRRVDGFVQHTDLMPTLLDLSGIKIPPRVTGESLRPLMESGKGSRRDTIVTGWGEHASVRSPEWNYIGRWNQGPPFEELYDLTSDRAELHNVAAKHPAVVSELRAKLKVHVESGWAITKGRVMGVG
ncbi:MAG: sulfatase family protein, partial [Bryobacteraceae bacterium]